MRLTQRVAKVALRSLVNGTPVDKGVARSNWRVSIGVETRKVIPAFAPGKKLGIGETQNARATIQAGISKINLLRVGKGGKGRAGSALFITNSVPYLDQLRSGRSPQQSFDWVNGALIEAAAQIRQVRLLSRRVKDDA